MSSIDVRLLAALLLLVCAGCGADPAFVPVPRGANKMVRLDVPFVAQTHRTDCGPVALASVLAFHGRNVPLEEVTRNVFTPAMSRTLLPDMENYARRLGFPARSGRGDIAFLRNRINEGRPLILLLDMGGTLASQGHYVVVIGHDAGGFVLHAGTLENAYLPDADLLARWEAMRRLYLVLE